MLDRKNLLVVEPRGVGASSPLLCPGLDLGAPETVAACADRLGPRARFFTADQAAADMDAVRRALGVARVTFYGNSYGTLYAQAYAARFPDRLEAVFLDSVTVTDRDGYALWPLRSRPDHLALICERSHACRALPGDAAGTWYRLVAHLRDRPDPHFPLSALSTLNNVVYDPVFGREVNAAATAYLSGDPKPLRRLVRVLTDLPLPPPGAPELAGYLAYRCGDGGFPFDRDAAPAERARQLERHLAEERPFAPFTLEDIGIENVAAVEPCVNWPTPRRSPPVPPQAPRTTAPIMAVGGDFDSHSPAEVAEAVRAYPNAAFVRVPFGAHSLAWGGGPVGECVRTAMRTFLTDPAHRIPRTDCTAENYRAAGAFPRSVADVRPLPVRGLKEPERRVLAAAFATAEDAVSRRNPYALYHSMLTEEAGLRGGRIRFGDDGAAVALEKTRFVDDLQVSGTIRLAASGEAVADVDVTRANGRAHRVTLSWRPFTAVERPAMSGVFDGRRFTVPPA
ncbi:alpha/beta fold hydrolase [Thermostaphylospora chromogena]|uniref:alpha/beta fold hydrolase n=1 Tax=Thermostaphylospora chromogena TaxID=35622 RepID=UPI0013F5DB46|nr:alpha/beta fold hydrolase [Thermostaphylospora chromogena]